MLDLYARLWDEDEQMMQAREVRLNESRHDGREINLGNADDVMKQLQNGDEPVFQVGRREYRLRTHQGKLSAVPTICPHLLGPLSDAPTEGSEENPGILYCPWHGYRFDLETGQCLAPATADCRLPPSPDITQENGELIARMG